jgi:sterol desaturase/sphingolipid hydroxylase (fatty acid hydroxylase superfamily)
LATAWAAVAALHAVQALHRHEAFSWPSLADLQFNQNHLVVSVMIIGFFLAELASGSWKDSAAHRLLTQTDDSTWTDIFYLVIDVTGVSAILVTLTSVGLSVCFSAIASNILATRFAADLPLWIAVPIIFALRSFCEYWRHRLMHMPLFWALHSTHHSARDLNIVTSSRRHPLDAFAAGVLVGFVPTILGFSPEAVAIATMMVVNHALYVHSNLPTVGWIDRYVIYGPHGHAIHHSTDPLHQNTNYSDLVIWDRMFGTYTSDRRDDLSYGIVDDKIYLSPRPWRDILAVEVLWLRGIWRALMRARRRTTAPSLPLPS